MKGLTKLSRRQLWARYWAISFCVNHWGLNYLVSNSLEHCLVDYYHVLLNSYINQCTSCGVSVSHGNV